MILKESSLYVSNPRRSAHFFQKALGLKLIALLPQRHAFLRLGQQVLLCFKASATRKKGGLPPHGAAGAGHIAFEVSKAAYPKWRKKIAKHAKIIHDQVWFNGTRSFYFRDPDGNLLELIEPGFWEKIRLPRKAMP